MRTNKTAAYCTTILSFITNAIHCYAAVLFYTQQLMHMKCVAAVGPAIEASAKYRILTNVSVVSVEDGTSGKHT